MASPRSYDRHCNHAASSPDSQIRPDQEFGTNSSPDFVDHDHEDVCTNDPDRPGSIIGFLRVDYTSECSDHDLGAGSCSKPPLMDYASLLSRTRACCFCSNYPRLAWKKTWPCSCSVPAPKPSGVSAAPGPAPLGYYAPAPAPVGPISAATSASSLPSFTIAAISLISALVFIAAASS
ncbi:unnamed protein product [Sphagnum tenellum]